MLILSPRGELRSAALQRGARYTYLVATKPFSLNTSTKTVFFYFFIKKTKQNIFFIKFYFYYFCTKLFTSH